MQSTRHNVPRAAGGLHPTLRRSIPTLLSITAMLSCLAAPSWADDDDIVNAGGFELPFTTVFLGTGQLDGQINPAGEGQVLPPGQWMRTPAAGGGSAVVQSTVFAPGGGTQGVRVNRAANTDVRYGVPVDHLGYPDYPTPFPPEPLQPIIRISWDMRVEQSVGGEPSNAPLMGVDAFDRRGSSTGLLSMLSVNAATGAIVYRAAGTGIVTPTGSTIQFGLWNHFDIQLDYSTDTYTIFRNSAALGTFGFVDAGLDEFSEGDISATAASNAPGPGPAPTGTAYFDNFLIREGLVPEPGSSTVVLLTLGAGLIRRART
jgi:hypothetical protein